MIRFVGVCILLAATLTFAPGGTARPAQAGQLGPVDRAQLECLALNIYFEARSEPLAGQLAIAFTTLNRVADRQFPDTICGVVRQGGDEVQGRCQFSWWCDGKSDRVQEGDAWAEALHVARRALREPAPDPTRGALFFHVAGANPGWARDRELTARIGRHRFYR